MTFAFESCEMFFTNIRKQWNMLKSSLIFKKHTNSQLNNSLRISGHISCEQEYTDIFSNLH